LCCKAIQLQTTLQTSQVLETVSAIVLTLGMKTDWNFLHFFSTLITVIVCFDIRMFNSDLVLPFKVYYNARFSFFEITKK